MLPYPMVPFIDFLKWTIIVLIIVVAVAIAIYFVLRYRERKKQEEEAGDEVDQLLREQ